MSYPRTTAPGGEKSPPRPRPTDEKGQPGPTPGDDGAAAPRSKRKRGPDGRFLPSDGPPRAHRRETEYPSGYREGVREKVLDRATIKEGPDKGKILTVDGDIVDRSDPRLTLDHKTPVVEHWNETGRNSSREVRNDWYNDLDNLQPRLRSRNSSDGGKLGHTPGGQFDQNVGPDYRRTTTPRTPNLPPANRSGTRGSRTSP